MRVLREKPSGTKECRDLKAKLYACQDVIAGIIADCPICGGVTLRFWTSDRCGRCADLLALLHRTKA